MSNKRGKNMDGHRPAKTRQSKLSGSFIKRWTPNTPEQKKVNDLVEHLIEIVDFHLDQVNFRGVEKNIIRQKMYSRACRLDIVGFQLEAKKK